MFLMYSYVALIRPILGHHEKRKDEFKPEFSAWNYAIRGKTLDKRDLRIAVSFNESTKLLIITAIEIIKKGE